MGWGGWWVGWWVVVVDGGWEEVEEGVDGGWCVCVWVVGGGRGGEEEEPNEPRSTVAALPRTDILSHCG